MLVVGGVDIRTEADEIVDFYEVHGRAHLPTPAIEALCKAAEDGALYRIDRQKAVDSKRRELVALGGLFRIAEGKNGLVVYELAGLALNGSVVGRLSPCTLQDLLLWTRVCGFACEAANSNSCIISTIVDANQRSKEAMTRGGLTAFSSPKWLRTSHRGWQTDPAKAVDSYVLPPAQVAVHAEALSQFLKNPEVSRINAKTSKLEKHEVRFKLDWVRPLILSAIIQPLAVTWTDKVPAKQLVALDGDKWIEF